MNRYGLAMILSGLSATAGPAGALSPTGFAFVGVVTPECSRSLEDGRLFAEHAHRLRAGQAVGVRVRSAGFAPILEIVRQGSPGPPLARVSGSADARAAATVIRAPEDGTYVFRISTRLPRAGGRYRLEIDRPGRIDPADPGEDAELARPYPGCAPLIMGSVPG